MQIRLVFVNVSPGSERDVHEYLQKKRGVTEAHPLLGGYDIVARIEAESEDIKPIIDDIRNYQGVLGTKTLTPISLV